MPRLSLYKPERGNDYKFIDRQISEMFQAGGTDVYLHKYTGTEAVDEAGNVVAKDHTQIQDLIFLENRDRKYDQSIYRIRGLYNVQNIDFNLSQFGLFIDNDTLYMTVHINDFIKYVGRKPLSGDVLELPHLRDEFALNDQDVSLPRYYVIEDVGRASEGFSATWYPHLYRLRLKRVTDSQQFADIFNKAALDANGDPLADGTTLRDLLSTYNKEVQLVNDTLLAEAEADSAKSGYETRQFFTLAVDSKTGKPVISRTSDNLNPSADNDLETTDVGLPVPVRTGYTGYLVGDGFPVNGYVFGTGIQFPLEAQANDFFLRTDFLPNRLFRYDGIRWIKVEDNVRATMTNPDPTRAINENNPDRQTLKTSFINNTSYIYNGLISSDFVRLSKGDYVINTNFDYPTSAPFVEFKQSLLVFGYKFSDYDPSLISNVNGKIRITLPVTNGIQEVVPEDGSWRVSLCNHREAQKQSLSKALRPKADL
jgi:hypothetical protein